MYSTPRYAPSDTTTMFTIVSPKMATAVRRCCGLFKLICGQPSSEGSLPARRRRRSIHAPTGIRSSPRTKTPGRSRKKTRPIYGLECRPNKSARKTTMNKTALMVVSTIPTTEIGLRISRTSRAMWAVSSSSLLQSREVGDQRVHVVFRQRVGFHLRLSRRLRLRRHALRIDDPLPDFVRLDLGRDAIERALLVAFVADRMAQRALLIRE